MKEEIKKSLPTYQECMYPVLLYLNKGVHYKELFEPVCKYFNLSEEQKSLQLEKSGHLIMQSNIGWAKTYLSQAEFIQSVSRGIWQLTEQGKKLLKKIENFQNKKITNNLLLVLSEKFQVFNNKSHYQILKLEDITEEIFNEINKSVKQYKDTSIKEELEESEQNSIESTPDVNLEEAYSYYRTRKIQEIQEILYTVKDNAFEKMVIDVLTEYGYGSAELNEVTRATRDGGIDGLIIEDKLGFNKIGVQVKRFKDNNGVGSPNIQTFLGALGTLGLTKGIFVTSSYFTDPARITAKKDNTKQIVLIDGEALATLMFDHSIEG